MILRSSVQWRLLALLLTLFLLTTPLQLEAAYVQSKPSLSGTWKLDMDASEFTASKQDLVYDGILLEIVHRDPELKISRTIYKKKKVTVQKLLYYCNGQGEENPPVAGLGKVKSVTKWDGELLVSNSKTDQGNVETEATEVWQLSTDGQMLTHYTLSKAPRFSEKVIVPLEMSKLSKIKRVYRKEGP